jgi:hypothetical protein
MTGVDRRGTYRGVGANHTAGSNNLEKDRKIVDLKPSERKKEEYKVYYTSLVQFVKISERFCS